MKNNSKYNKGFIVPLITAIVALLIVGGVYMVWKNNQNKQITASVPVNVSIENNSGSVSVVASTTILNSTTTPQTNNTSVKSSVVASANAPKINSISPSTITIGLTGDIVINGSNFDPLGGYAGIGWLTHSHVFVMVKNNSNGQTGILWEGGSQGGATSTANQITAVVYGSICMVSQVAVGGCPSGKIMMITPGQYSLYVIVDGRGTSNSVQLAVPGPQGHVTVTSPNGGETLKIGQTYTISWNSSDIGSSTVSIFLNDDSINCSGYTGCWSSFGVASGLQNTGSYSWNTNEKMFGDAGPNTVPVTAGSEYKIEICKDPRAVCDSSDNYFTITNQNSSAPTNLETYTNSQYNYTFQYPSDFALAANLTPAQQSLTSSYMESCAARGEGERQVLDGSYNEINSLCYVGGETTDGFDASALNVFVSTTTSMSDCQTIEQKGDEGGAYQQQTTQTTIGGITFYEDTLNDAGLSHYVDTNSFRTYHEGICYDIQLDIESHAGDSPTWKLDPQFVAMMNSKLESILSTFKFTN